MNTDKPSMKKERRATVSITDLVAQMAGQQAHEQVQKLENEMQAVHVNLRRRLTALEQRDNEFRQELNDLKAELRAHRIKDIKDADIQRVTNSLQRKGFAWPEVEDKQLEDELRAAFEAIAANHGRSAHGIRCRIQDKNLLKEIQL